MNYNIISTGSKGNAVVLNDNILIDCGVPFKALKTVYKDLRLVLLTHIHGDHFKPQTLKRLHDERPLLRFGCCEWLVEYLVNVGVKPKQIDIYRPGNWYRYKIAEISPVELYHNAPNCGYKLKIGDKKVFYVTDTGHLEGVTAKGYDLYMVEANHKQDEIIELIKAKDKIGMYAYERDVITNHLSQEQAADFIAANAGVNSRYVYLHQHENKERRIHA